MVKRVMLGVCTVALAACAGGQTAAAVKAPVFDVVSIKPNVTGMPHGFLQILPDGDREIASNVPMYTVLGFAFDFQRKELVLGAPDWTRTERWDIEAKVAPGDLAAYHALSTAQKRAMLLPVLVERCKLQYEIVKKEIPVYALAVGKNGIRMRKATVDAQAGPSKEWDLKEKRGELHGRGVPVEALLYALGRASLGRQLVDRTGLKGVYDFDLVWTPEEEHEAGAGELAGASIFTAVQEQLGLRLEPAKALMDTLSITHMERPTAD